MNFGQTSLFVFIALFISVEVVLGSVDERKVALEIVDPDVQITKVVSKQAMGPKFRHQTNTVPNEIITISSDSDEEMPLTGKETKATIETFHPETVDIVDTTNVIENKNHGLPQFDSGEPTQEAQMYTLINKHAISAAQWNGEDRPSTPPAPQFDFAADEGLGLDLNEVALPDGKDKKKSQITKTVGFSSEKSFFIEIQPLPRNIEKFKARDSLEHRENRLDPDSLETISYQKLARDIPNYKEAHHVSSIILKRKASSQPKNEPKPKRALYGKKPSYLQNEVFIPKGQSWNVYDFCTTPRPGRIVLYNLRHDIKLAAIVDILSASELGLVKYEPGYPPLARQKTDLLGFIQLVRDMNGLALPFAFVHFETKELAKLFIKAFVRTRTHLKLGARASIDFAPSGFSLEEHAKVQDIPSPPEKIVPEIPVFEEDVHVNPAPESLLKSDSRVVLFNLMHDVTVEDIAHALSNKALHGSIRSNGPKDLSKNIQLFKNTKSSGEAFAYVHMSNAHLARQLVKALRATQVLGAEVGIDIAEENFSLNAHLTRVSFKNSHLKVEQSPYRSRRFWASKYMPTVQIIFNRWTKVGNLIFHSKSDAEEAAKYIRGEEPTLTILKDPFAELQI